MLKRRPIERTWQTLYYYYYPAKNVLNFTGKKSKWQWKKICQTLQVSASPQEQRWAVRWFWPQLEATGPKRRFSTITKAVKRRIYNTSVVAVVLSISVYSLSLLIYINEDTYFPPGNQFHQVGFFVPPSRRRRRRRRVGGLFLAHVTFLESL